MEEEYCLKECKQCNKRFGTLFKVQLYCSVECRNSYNRFYRTRHTLLEGTQYINCEICGRETVQRKKKKFCSAKCSTRAYLNRNYLRERNAKIYEDDEWVSKTLEKIKFIKH